MVAPGLAVVLDLTQRVLPPVHAPLVPQQQDTPRGLADHEQTDDGPPGVHGYHPSIQIAVTIPSAAMIRNAIHRSFL